MYRKKILAGATDQSVVIRALNASGAGVAITDATAGLALRYHRIGAAAATAIVATDLAALDDAHTDGGLLHIGDGYHRLDIPDAAVAAAGDVLISGVATDITIIGASLEVVPEYRRSGYLWLGAPSAIDSDSFTLPAGHGLDQANLDGLVAELVAGTDAFGRSRRISAAAADVFTVDPPWDDGGADVPSGSIVLGIRPERPATVEERTRLANLDTSGLQNVLETMLIDGAITFGEAMRAILAVSAANATGLESGVLEFANMGDTITRLRFTFSGGEGADTRTVEIVNLA